MNSIFLRISELLKIFCITAILLHFIELPAQEIRPGIPVVVSIFSESVSLPNFRGLTKNPNWGVSIGTELRYGQNRSNGFFQSINLGYYQHKKFQDGIYLRSELGYRKYFGDFFTDISLGGGYLHLVSQLKRYQPSGEGHTTASQHMHKFMPAAGLNLGYRFNHLAVFARYEIFGEFPFSYDGAPLLPHKAFHLGTRFNAL
ncbi:MAG: hypothetical protein IPL46_09830 [Saprospiraceae bacterium]|nr:hypothetical protein [Saprospiraceae bacterium]